MRPESRRVDATLPLRTIWAQSANLHRFSIKLYSKGVIFLRLVKSIILALILGLVVLYSSPMFAGEGTDAPTASQSPEVIDQVWRQASSKYDSERAAVLKQVDRIIQQGPFRADWESLQKYKVPEWYRDAKFGIFIHWGVYSVPAFGSEWYPRKCISAGFRGVRASHRHLWPDRQVRIQRLHSDVQGRNFDPAAWARLFKESGAKYIVPVFEHHDGFAMYDSGLSDWTAAKMGPHRDLVGDLAKAVRAEGLRLGASSHRVEHNFFFDGGRTSKSNVNDPKYADFYGPAHTWLEAKEGNPLRTTSHLFPPPGPMTGLPVPPRSSRSTIRISCGSIGGSDNRRFVTPSNSLRSLLLQRLRKIL